MLKKTVDKIYVSLSFFILGLMLLFLLVLYEKEYTDAFVGNYFQTHSAEQIVEFDRDALERFVLNKDKLTLMSYNEALGKIEIYLRNVNLPVAMQKGRFFKEEDFETGNTCILGASYTEYDIGSEFQDLKVIGILHQKYESLSQFVIKAVSPETLLSKGFLTLNTFQNSAKELSSFSQVVTEKVPRFYYSKKNQLITLCFVFTLHTVLLLLYFLMEHLSEMKMRFIFGHSSLFISFSFMLRFFLGALMGILISFLTAMILDIHLSILLVLLCVLSLSLLTWLLTYLYVKKRERSFYAVKRTFS